MSTFDVWDEVEMCKRKKFQIGDKVVVTSDTTTEVEGYIDYISAYFPKDDGDFYGLRNKPNHQFHVCILELLEHAKKEEQSEDKVNKPNHYQLKGDFEVKHLMELLLDRIEESDKIQFSHFQSSCYKEMMQYLLRCMLKNGYEDIYKARYYLNEVIRVHEERMRS